jgi:hypothetical protein
MQTESEQFELPNVSVNYNQNEDSLGSVTNTANMADTADTANMTDTTDTADTANMTDTADTTEKPVKENKYTKVDNLDEDDPISYDGKDGNPDKLRKPLYGIFSVVTPEGVMNTNIRAFKCRGVFDDHETAEKWAKKLGENDVFDVFVGDLYKWLPFDADTDKATHVQYRNKKEQKLIMAQRENELNELVGRKKEMLEKEKKGSRRRKADRILAGRNETGGATSNVPSKESSKEPDTETKKNKVPKVSRNDNRKQVLERMQKIVLERKKKKEDEEEKRLQEAKKNQEANISGRENELKSKEDNLSKLEKNMAEISKRLGKK